MFQKGNKLAKGGRRPGGGRPTKEEQEAKRTAIERAKGKLEMAADKIVEKYIERALAKNADRLLMHAIDKLISDAPRQLEHGALDENPSPVIVYLPQNGRDSKG